MFSEAVFDVTSQVSSQFLTVLDVEMCIPRFKRVHLLHVNPPRISLLHMVSCILIERASIVGLVLQQWRRSSHVMHRTGH